MMAAAATAVTVLLVEDDPDAREAVSLALRRQGHEVDAVGSAGAALVWLEVSPKPAAAIIDLGLPDASGSVVLWRLRRDHGWDVPVAVVTGLPEPQKRPDLARGLPDVIFPKPVDLTKVVAWLRSIS